MSNSLIVITTEQYEQLIKLDMCLWSLREIGCLSERPDFDTLMILFDLVTNLLRNLCDEIEETKSSNLSEALGGSYD